MRSAFPQPDFFLEQGIRFVIVKAYGIAFDSVAESGKFVSEHEVIGDVADFAKSLQLFSLVKPDLLPVFLPDGNVRFMQIPLRVCGKAKK